MGARAALGSVPGRGSGAPRRALIPPRACWIAVLLFGAGPMPERSYGTYVRGGSTRDLARSATIRLNQTPARRLIAHDEHNTPNAGCTEDDLKLDSLTIDAATLPAASYQTAPLVDYTPVLVRRAAELFRLVQQRAGTKAHKYKGSFSVFARSSDSTAAKIVIYERGKGKVNGRDPLLGDGIYVLIRVSGNGSGRTIGVAPKHDERFAYFRLSDGQSLDEIADFIAACVGAQ